MGSRRTTRNSDVKNTMCTISKDRNGNPHVMGSMFGKHKMSFTAFTTEKSKSGVYQSGKNEGDEWISLMVEYTYNHETKTGNGFLNLSKGVFKCKEYDIYASVNGSGKTRTGKLVKGFTTRLSWL